MIKVKDLEILFKDNCKVMRKVLIEEDSITKQKEKLIYNDLKCKFSYKNQKPLKQDQTASYTNQYLIHYSSKDYEIKEGDKILFRNEKYTAGEIIYRGEYCIAILEKEVKA